MVNKLINVDPNKWDDFAMLCAVNGWKIKDKIDEFLDKIIEKHSKILKGVKNGREKK